MLPRSMGAEHVGFDALLANSGVDGADMAMQLLQEIKREFAPLLRKRGWYVQTLQEMCCCACGGGIRRSPNILGMCHSGEQGRSSSKIEIRLRKPKSHVFMNYEGSIVGTICHELAHIVHMNHSKAFYKLMDELIGEFEATRTVAGADGRGTFAGAGASLDPEKHNPSHLEARGCAAAAAEARLQKQKLMGQPGGQRLGGGALCWKQLSPQQLAAEAAERRRRDERWCPSALAHADAADAQGTHAHAAAPRHQPSAAAGALQPGAGSSRAAIGRAALVHPPPRAAVASAPSEGRKRKRGPTKFLNLTEDCSPGCSCCAAWDCSACTLRNRAGTLACAVCQAPRRNDRDFSAIEPLDNMWQCLVCTVLNPASNTSCAVCLQGVRGKAS